MEKQIEEMACKKCLHFEACQIAFRNSKDLGIYDCTEEEYFNSTLDCDYYTDKTIYRKASEIFEEIENVINNELKNNYKVLPQFEFSNELWNKMSGRIEALKEICDFIAELKKKYESENADGN